MQVAVGFAIISSFLVHEFSHFLEINMCNLVAKYNYNLILKCEYTEDI